MHKISWSLAALLSVTLLAAALRLWQLDVLPPGFHLDESYQGLEAWRILGEPGYHPFFLRGNFGPLPANAYLNVATFWLAEQFGGAAGPVAMRTTSAVVGVLTVLSVYGLAGEIRRLSLSHNKVSGNPAVATASNSGSSNPTAPALILNQPELRSPLPARGEGVWEWGLSPLFPLFATATLALMRWHLHFSRMAIEPIYVPLVWTVSTWLLLRGWRTRGWLAYAGSGLVLGAGVYTYRGAWIIPLLLALVVLHLLLMAMRTERLPLAKIIQRLRGPLLAALVATLLVAPLAWFFFNNPDLFTTRLQQVNIVGETASPADSTLLGNVAKTARMFGPALGPLTQLGDLDPRRNLPGAPALSWPLAIAFYLGLARCLWGIRRVTFSLPLIGLVGLLLPGVASEYAPHFHRVLGAVAPTALLVAAGLDWLWQLGAVGSRTGAPWRARTRPNNLVMRFSSRLLAILLLLGGGLVESHNYFNRWAKLPALYYAFDEGLWQIGHALADQPPGTPIYLTPRDMAHPTLAFAWQTERTELLGSPSAPVSFDGRHIFPLAAQPPGQAELYAVIEHEDFRTSLLLPGALPAAFVEREFLDDAGDVYARFYARPAGSAFAWPPDHALDVTLGDGITLVGYDVQPEALRAGEILYLQLRWLVADAPAADWTVFTHVRRLDGERVAGQDGQPGAGSLPMTRWRAGWRILDEYQIALPADLAPGTYELWTGLYQPSGEQLPASGEGVRLGRVEILGSE